MLNTSTTPFRNELEMCKLDLAPNIDCIDGHFKAFQTSSPQVQTIQRAAEQQQRWQHQSFVQQH
jgi:hypothetical protein